MKNCTQDKQRCRTVSEKKVRQAELVGLDRWNLCDYFDDNHIFFTAGFQRLGILKKYLTDETFCDDCTIFICIQVKSASGAWVEADPIPGTILGIAYWLRRYFPSMFFKYEFCLIFSLTSEHWRPAGKMDSWPLSGNTSQVKS
jgi:hypothetical protein